MASASSYTNYAVRDLLAAARENGGDFSSVLAKVCDDVTSLSAQYSSSEHRDAEVQARTHSVSPSCSVYTLSAVSLCHLLCFLSRTLSGCLTLSLNMPLPLHSLQYCAGAVPTDAAASALLANNTLPVALPLPPPSIAGSLALSLALCMRWRG